MNHKGFDDNLGFCVCGHWSYDHGIRFRYDGECNICICDHFVTEMNVFEREKWNDRANALTQDKKELENENQM